MFCHIYSFSCTFVSHMLLYLCSCVCFSFVFCFFLLFFGVISLLISPVFSCFHLCPVSLVYVCSLVSNYVV